MMNQRVTTDITVIGGGLSGICAAIAAARLGRTVALVQNRPVLGGNSSSEVRVWVCGATGHGVNRYARETGIMGELFLENQYRNAEGNPYYWDMVLLDAVRSEPNIQLFLNTDVHEVDASGDADNRRIDGVTGWMMGSERKIRFDSSYYLDCTGDGLVGFLAGAKHRIGREARHEYNEEWAPEVADDITLGSTLLFYTKDAGEPVKFIPPSFAKDITQTSIPMKRVIRSGDSGCHYWWIEWGGELDTVHENERIRDELWSIVYGIWDYIKNSGKFDADNMTLEWVGSVPGKREYRRFIGDYVLNQNDILAQQPFEDRIAFGGWSIDLHPPQGMYATESGSKHLHADGIYHIPFRSLYSANVSNLLFAGRNISASHVAFGTTRVMATCAVIGEAAGTGAALCFAEGITPRELYLGRLETLQQTLLRQDASVIGLRNRDTADLAMAAEVTASDTLRRIAVEDADQTHAMSSSDVGILIPVDGEGGITGIELLLSAAQTTDAQIELWSTGKLENYVPHTKLGSMNVQVSEGSKRWVPVELKWSPGADHDQNAFLVIKANELLSVHVSDQAITGVICFSLWKKPHVDPNLEDRNTAQPVVHWEMRTFARRSICFRQLTSTEAYSPNKVIDGYNRPYGGPHMWVSEPLVDGHEAWLQLSWKQMDGSVRAIEPRELHLTFNDDVNEDLINLHHHRTPFAVIPELVRDYRIEAWNGNGWTMLHRETDNRRRRRVHAISGVKTTKLRVVVERTNGCPRAEIVEVRVYASGDSPFSGADQYSHRF